MNAKKIKTFIKKMAKQGVPPRTLTASDYKRHLVIMGGGR